MLLLRYPNGGCPDVDGERFPEWINTSLPNPIQGVDDPVLMKLVDYVRKTWITSTVYQITSWCVFGQPIRTNNDVEVTLLPIQIKLVSEGKLPRYERQQFRTNSASIMQLWDQYSNKDVTTTQLLKICGRINGPVLDHWTSQTFCSAYIDINM